MVYEVQTEQQLQQVVAAAPGAVVLDFYAQWCGPCKAVAPQLHQLEAAFGGACTVVKIDVDRAPDLMEYFAVAAMPTFVVLRGGVEVGRVQGANLQQVAGTVSRALSTA
jgi:thioredoxin 1